MRVLAAISVLAFLTLLFSCIVIALYIHRKRRQRARTTPAQPPPNLANPL